MLVCKSAMQRKALCIPGAATLNLTVQGYVISRTLGVSKFRPALFIIGFPLLQAAF
ncbi:hypothetical protein Maes01_01775 [Microbulbifer aestuariivivens]|uniref:Uncharacterized protein n=1 Tax=Microbulbifer aestuariivivens TaxID=1908308 RepID=A0ABP9WQ45_9GAMM